MIPKILIPDIETPKGFTIACLDKASFDLAIAIQTTQFHARNIIISTFRDFELEERFRDLKEATKRLTDTLIENTFLRLGSIPLPPIEDFDCACGPWKGSCRYFMFRMGHPGKPYQEIKTIVLHIVSKIFTRRAMFSKSGYLPQRVRERVKGA